MMMIHQSTRSLSAADGSKATRLRQQQNGDFVLFQRDFASVLNHFSRPICSVAPSLLVLFHFRFERVAVQIFSRQRVSTVTSGVCFAAFPRKKPSITRPNIHPKSDSTSANVRYSNASVSRYRKKCLHLPDSRSPTFLEVAARIRVEKSAETTENGANF
jgi:hypothetical protein